MTNYPTSLDTAQTLYTAHDSLRMTLAIDYNPGDSVIYLAGDPIVMRKFPATGIVTLTEQCSDPEHRALAFSYTAVDAVNFTISGLTLLPEFAGLDSVKPKRLTDVTQNVVAQHHNALKDALIAAEEFVGIQGTTDKRPLGKTMEGRINYLRQLVLSPKAFFSVDHAVGLVPFTATFTDLSFRLGTDGTTQPVIHLWDFGDNTTSQISAISGISTISVTSQVTPSCITGVVVEDLDNGTITKTYCSPGIYSVSLTVSNKYGTDTFVYPDLINARVAAPDVATIEPIIDASTQLLVSGGVYDGSVYIPPVIRSPVETAILLEIPSGADPNRPGLTYAGETLSNNKPIDPIAKYTWTLGDDLSHGSASSTRAAYSVGGLYDLALRADTTLGAYRITNYSHALDIVERQNLWLFCLTTGSTLQAFEYGLMSGVFKTSGPTTTISRDASFLSGAVNSAQQTREFNKNTAFVPRSNVDSGDQGSSLLFYASGRTTVQPTSQETVKALGFNGFLQTFDTSTPGFARQWNWAHWDSPQNTYFLLGTTSSLDSANAVLSAFDVASSVASSSTLTSSNFGNGALELLTNVSQFDANGASIYGNFAVYRAAWKGNTGYLLRNDTVGPFFRIRSFYQSSGTVGSPVQAITKLSDMTGPTRQEGELVSLSGGLYFFDNSGSISIYDDLGGVWGSGGPGLNSPGFRSLQDSSVADFDDEANTLLACSDGDQAVYLSFDYSTNAFIKFSGLDNTFTSLASRPTGTQFAMGIY